MKLKKKLRNKIKAKRKILTEAQQKYAARSVWQQLYKQPFFKQAQRIGLYLPIRGELNTLPIIDTAWRQGKAVYIPVLNSNGPKLSFCKIEASTKMRLNQYGILEPDIQQQKAVPPYTLDLVFIPLVSFDIYGNRLGMGKGYYDRTFGPYKFLNKPLRVGLAYDFQKASCVPTTPRDVPLHLFITEKRIYPTQRS